MKDDRNIHGPGSVAVPGMVAGISEAHRRHGRMSWKELLAPSVTFAGEGLLVDWWTTLMIASCAIDLRRYPSSAAAYLVDGLPPPPPWATRTQVRLPQDKFKASLSYLAKQMRTTLFWAISGRVTPPGCRAGEARCRPADLAACRGHRPSMNCLGGRGYCDTRLKAGRAWPDALGLLQQGLGPGARAPGCPGPCRLRDAMRTAYREG